jgi:Cytochrome c554 and c-prime
MCVIVRISRRALALLICVAASSLIEPAEAEEPTPVWVGTGSCSATSCHKGRREPLDLKGSEYDFSAAYDPHTRAYQVLYDDRSRVILKNLKDLENVENIEKARTITNDLCLRCHVYQGFDSKAPKTRAVGFALEDGVGCEVCHGAAEKWLVPHTRGWWKGLTQDQKQVGFGLYPTKDLLARGKKCAECHVGNGTAEVNHDLVAAGHPRLNFEYGGQLAKLPKHWRINDDKARNPDYEAKVWALGQVLAAKASLDLLESRALRSLSDEATPWPELAEYSCFSCHHDLAEPNRAQLGLTSPGRPGELPWGTWYLPMTRAVGISGLDSDSPGSPLGDLRKAMARPAPDASLVVQRSRAASDELARIADSINRGRIAPSEARSMLARALKAGEEGQPLDWDRAAQQYLAIVALDKALAEYDPRYSDPTVRAGLERILKGLDLPKQVDRRGGIFDSPYRYDPRKVGEDLRTLQAALPKP